MKKLLFIALLALIAGSCKNEKTGPAATPESAATQTEYQSFGEKIDTENVAAIVELKEKYAQMQPGDTTEVKIKAAVKEVCQKKGCWMKVAMGEEEVMVKFEDYAFFVPKDISGREVILNGKAYIEEMSVEDRRHFAEDGGATPEEIEAITESKRTLSFMANGVLVPAAEMQ